MLVLRWLQARRHGASPPDVADAARRREAERWHAETARLCSQEVEARAVVVAERLNRRPGFSDGGKSGSPPPRRHGASESG